MRLKYYHIIILLLSLFALQSYSQTVNVKIVETSDVHGAIFPYDFINDKPLKSSLAQITTFVKQERNKTDQHVILLDNGDILQGQPVVYYYNFEKPDSTHILADIMNYMGYDAGAVGNHDIEAGHKVYDKFEKELDFPWLSANTLDTKTNEPYFEPYTIIKKDGVKIAILGLITPAIPTWLPEKIWEGMRFDDMIQTAKKWVSIIKEKENPDLLVGLFHSGVDYTYNNQRDTTYKNENASQLVAERVKGFDIVFVGHDHVGWNFTVKNDSGKKVYILGTKAGAQTMAVANIEMVFNIESNSWQKNISGEIIETENYAADKEFMDKFDYAMEEVKQYVAHPIGEITQTISTKESLFGDSPFVDLIHKIQLEITGADVSFASPLSFNSEIQKGKIFVRDMFNLYKYENLLYTMDLTGREIKNYLEYSYGHWFNEMKTGNDHLLNFKTNEDGDLIYSKNHPLLNTPYYNYSSAAGINYSVDISKPPGERIIIFGLSNGSTFEEDKHYNVAVNSYRGNGGGGHLTTGAGIPQEDLSLRILNSTEKDLRYYLMKWIEKVKIVKPESYSNWKIIPEKYWEAGKEEDYNLLFKEF